MPAELIEQAPRWLPLPGDRQMTLAAWVAGSLAAGVGARWALWAMAQWSRGWRDWLGGSSARIAAWLGWMAWLVAPGYAALLLGILSPRLMGLTQIDWGAPFGYGLAFAGLAVAILLAAGVTVRQRGFAMPAWPTLSAALAGSVLLGAEAGALQWHWAFYRAAAVQVAQELVASSPMMWGTWIGVGIVAVEGALNPWLWQDLQTPGQAERRVLRGVLLVATSVLFLISRNFWLLWATHALVAIILEPRLAGSKKGPPADKITARAP